MKVKLNLNTFLGTTFTENFTLSFNNVGSIQNVNIEYYLPNFSSFVAISLQYKHSNQEYKCVIVYKDTSEHSQSVSFTGTDMYAFCITGYYLIVDGNVPTNVNMAKHFTLAYDEQIIEIEDDSNSILMCFMQNSKNNVVHKTLKPVVVLDGDFKYEIGIKTLSIELNDYFNYKFNYIFIPQLKRYYYVTNIQMVRDNLTRVNLSEDVLMTWEDLILEQEAFVTRNELGGSNKIVDDRYPLDNVYSVVNLIPVASENSLVNTHFNFDLTNSANVVVSSMTSLWDTKEEVNAPTGTELSNLAPAMTNAEWISFMNNTTLSYLYEALRNQDNYVSYINSVVLLPFDVETPYNDASHLGVRNGNVCVSDKLLCDDARFHDVNSIPSGHNAIMTPITHAGASPYFITEDFTITAENNNFLDYEPYTNYELYIAFVGWVKLNAIQILNKRLLVYYTLDYKTGMGTAYIYNKTDEKLIWSSNCQLGVKLDINVSNAQEITRQKQSNELNMILGLVSSAISIGVGAYTGNGVAIAGGIMGASKTIAHNVNANRMMFDRGQTTFGTSEGVLHAPASTIIRKTYYKKIINLPTLENIYARTQGYPINQYRVLDGMSGYTEIGEIHFNPKEEAIYQDEINEIVTLLMQGVIL